MAIRSKTTLKLVALYSLCAFQAATAQQITIDFEEFPETTYSAVAYTKGYVFTATGSSTSGVTTHVRNTTSHFRAYDSELACGGEGLAAGSRRTAPFSFAPLSGPPRDQGTPGSSRRSRPRRQEPIDGYH